VPVCWPDPNESLPPMPDPVEPLQSQRRAGMDDAQVVALAHAASTSAVLAEGARLTAALVSDGKGRR